MPCAGLISSCSSSCALSEFHGASLMKTRSASNNLWEAVGTRMSPTAARSLPMRFMASSEAVLKAIAMRLSSREELAAAFLADLRRFGEGCASVAGVISSASVRSSCASVGQAICLPTPAAAKRF